MSAKISEATAYEVKVPDFSKVRLKVPSAGATVNVRIRVHRKCGAATVKVRN